MHRSLYFLAFLFILVLLAPFFTPGHGRKELRSDSVKQTSAEQLEEKWQDGRMLTTSTDYEEPSANVNPRTGTFFSHPAEAPESY